MGRGDEYGMAADNEDEAKAETKVIEDYAPSPCNCQIKMLCSNNNYSNNSKPSTNSNSK